MKSIIVFVLTSFGLIIKFSCTSTYEDKDVSEKIDTKTQSWINTTTFELELCKYSELVYDDFKEKFIIPKEGLNVINCDRIAIIKNGILKLKDEQKGTLLSHDLTKVNIHYNYPQLNFVTPNREKIEINLNSRSFVHMFNYDYQKMDWSKCTFYAITKGNYSIDGISKLIEPVEN